MILSSLEAVQIVIDLVTAVFLLTGIILIRVSGRQGLLKVARRIFAVMTVYLVADAVAYIFRGNTDAVSIVMTRLGNFTVFASELVWLYMGVELLRELLKDRGIIIGRTAEYITGGLCIGSFLILAVNLFTGIMYYFDKDNYYHRNTFWYVFAVLGAICLLEFVFIVLRYRKRLKAGMTVTLTLYAFLPLVLTGLQVYYYGLNFLGMASIIVLLLILGIDMHTTGRLRGAAGNYRAIREFLAATLMAFLVLLTMTFSLLISILNVRNITEENYKGDFENFFMMVENRMESDLIKVIMVSRTLARNSTLTELFSDGHNTDGETVGYEVSAILSPVQSALGYDMVFALDDDTLNFYTYEGYSRNIALSGEDDDVWYRNFLESGAEYELNVDADKDNDKRLTIFVNCRITGQNGETLGACGAGTNMAYLCSLLTEYEKNNQVDIELVNADGIVMIDADITRVGVASIENGYLADLMPGEIHYDETEGHGRLTAYMEDLGWYLVIVDYSVEDELRTGRIVLPSVLIFAAGLAIMLIAVFIIYGRERRDREEMEKNRRMAATDGLTGLGNRRGFDNEADMIMERGGISETIVVMMDVNGLKQVNDTYGHEAGDALLISAANVMKDAFSEYGSVYRTGGDEFIALLNTKEDRMPELRDRLDTLAAGQTFPGKYTLSISMGWAVSSGDNDSIAAMERKADERMYMDKEEYYRTTGIDRRRGHKA